MAGRIHLLVIRMGDTLGLGQACLILGVVPMRRRITCLALRSHTNSHISPIKMHLLTMFPRLEKRHSRCLREDMQ